MIEIEPVILREAIEDGSKKKIEIAALKMKIFFKGKTADGAIPNGDRIRKINSNTGDTNRDGTTGTVYASIGPEMNQGRLTIGYIVLWDTFPDIPVLVTDERIERI